jgi:hypothetical protein
LRANPYAVDSVTLWARYAANEKFGPRTKDFQKP